MSSTIRTRWNLLQWIDGHVDDHRELANDRIEWFRAVPFILLHVACLGVFFVGVSPVALAVAGALFVVRMFFITAFYHRYFSHRAFRTSRFFQLCMGIAGCTAGQRGPLWWAGHHRHHHAHADSPADYHSPREKGFLWSHTGWFLTEAAFATPVALLPDFEEYPELRLLDRFDWVPFVLLGVGLGVLGGAQVLFWGFFVSTVLLYHSTYTINSFAHRFGSRRFATRDDSRNNFALALLTLGEGWHNNHHHYPASARQGFYWWEIDLSYYGLWLMSKLHLIKDLRGVPARALALRRIDAGAGR